MNERTCNRCNRPLNGRQAKFCSHACANRDTSKRKSERAKAAPWKICTVEGCMKPARSRVADMCPMHYHRLYRYGTLERITDLRERGAIPNRAVDLRGVRYGTLVAMRTDGIYWVCQCDCGATRRASTGELNRTGDANTCGVAGRHLSGNAGYTAAHDRVRRAKGVARNHPCVDCGKPADHWSYDHADPNERASRVPRTDGIAYSLNPEHYEARCVSCHKRFDLSHINGTVTFDAFEH